MQLREKHILVARHPEANFLANRWITPLWELLSDHTFVPTSPGILVNGLHLFKGTYPLSVVTWYRVYFMTFGCPACYLYFCCWFNLLWLLNVTIKPLLYWFLSNLPGLIDWLSTLLLWPWPTPNFCFMISLRSWLA